MAQGIDQYKDLFCAEAEEQLGILSRTLLLLESAEVKESLYETLMRSAHTLKGSAATMGYILMADLAHHIEDVFHACMSGAFTLDANSTTQLLFAVDHLTSSLDEIKKNNKELSSDREVAMLKKMLVAKNGTSEQFPQKILLSNEIPVRVSTPDTIRVHVAKLDALMGIFEEMHMLRLRGEAMMLLAVDYVRSVTDHKTKERLSFISELEELFADFARLMNEHQDTLLAARLVPLEQIFDQFPRMVRDLSLREKKHIAFTVDGGDIAVDRTVVEGLGGALSHLLRNAVDHGIVSEGTINLSAQRSNNRVRVMIEDSGPGIDYEQVKRVARARNIRTSAELEKMGMAEITELLLHQNMSTSKIITDISGRGIGLAAVRGFAEDVGGRLEVISPIPETGGGSRFILDLPISLSAVHVLLVESQGHTFAIPFDHVIKTFHFTEADTTTNGCKVALSMDGISLPLFCLSKILRLADVAHQSTVRKQRIAILLQMKEARFLIEVDACKDDEHLLIKSLPSVLRMYKVFSGSAIAPDGRTILLLDTRGLLMRGERDILDPH